MFIEAEKKMAWIVSVRLVIAEQEQSVHVKGASVVDD
jgi:hypothetical protein